MFVTWLTIWPTCYHCSITMIHGWPQAIAYPSSKGKGFPIISSNIIRNGRKIQKCAPHFGLLSFSKSPQDWATLSQRAPKPTSFGKGPSAQNGRTLSDFPTISSQFIRSSYDKPCHEACAKYISCHKLTNMVMKFCMKGTHRCMMLQNWSYWRVCGTASMCARLQVCVRDCKQGHKEAWVCVRLQASAQGNKCVCVWYY